jgi:hypothetical protein
MDNVRVNGDNFFENVPAMIDSGSNYIFGDWDKVSELYGHLGGTLLEHAGFGYYSCEFRLRSVPCTFLLTACSTVRLFPNTGPHLRWQDV